MSNKKEYPPLTIQLVNRQNTSWTMEGTEKSENPVFMDFPGTWSIIPHSKVKDANGHHKPIRHILGCPSIDPEEQKKLGYVPNNLNDVIYITNGSLTVHREGSTVGLYDYLKAYQGNKNNKNRPDDAEIEFEEVIASEIAAGNVRDIADEMDAIALVASLRTQSPADPGVFVYDESLADLATLFDLDKSGSDDEIYFDLYNYARAYPQKFMQMAISPRKKLVLEVKQAAELGILTFDSERVTYTGTTSVLLAFKQKLNKEAQIKAVADHLLKPENKHHLDLLRTSIIEKKASSLETIS